MLLATLLIDIPSALLLPHKQWIAKRTMFKNKSWQHRGPMQAATPWTRNQLGRESTWRTTLWRRLPGGRKRWRCLKTMWPIGDRHRWPRFSFFLSPGSFLAKSMLYHWIMCMVIQFWLIYNNNCVYIFSYRIYRYSFNKGKIKFRKMYL